MGRTVWSSDEFDDKLAILFEEFEGREDVLQQSLNEVMKALLEGNPLAKARNHYNFAGSPSGDYIVPLIHDQVIVFSLGGIYRESLDYIDISETDHINLLNIERQRA